MDRDINKTEMDKILAAFSISQIQDSLTLFDWLTQKEKTVEDLRSHLKIILSHKDDLKKALGRAKRLPLKKCPNCSSQLQSFQVNHTRCTQVEGNYNVQYICPKCEYDEFGKV